MNWQEFWNSICDFFSNIGTNLYKFWIHPDEEGATPYLAQFLFALIILILGYFIIKLIIFCIRKALKLGKKKFANERNVKTFTVNTISIVLNILLVVLFLSLLGVDLTGLSTIFSSAILAIGLSLQDVVGNFASGIIILSSKPFIEGDYVSFPGQGVEGTVKEVRMLTTILQTTDRQTVVIPNKNITNNNLINYSNQPIRRAVFDFNVEYNSDVDAIKSIINKIFENDDRILKEQGISIVISGYSDGVFTLSARCYVPNNIYWDFLFDFYEKIYQEFKNNEIVLGVKKISVVQDNEITPLKKEEK